MKKSGVPFWKQNADGTHVIQCSIRTFPIPILIYSIIYESLLKNVLCFV